MRQMVGPMIQAMQTELNKAVFIEMLKEKRIGVATNKQWYQNERRKFIQWTELSARARMVWYTKILKKNVGLQARVNFKINQKAKQAELTK